MREIENFEFLITGIKGHLVKEIGGVEDYLEFDKEALKFMELKRILANTEFNTKRLAFIGRNLAFSIFFAVHDLYEEGQILLRQVLDLIYIIIYGANHILELDEIELGNVGQIGKIRTEVDRKLPVELKGKIKSHYRKLSCVVHGTVKDILSNVVSVNECWKNPGKLGHWKNDFHKTLEYGFCLCRTWFPMNYAKLDIALRMSLERLFPSLRKFYLVES